MFIAETAQGWLTIPEQWRHNSKMALPRLRTPFQPKELQRFRAIAMPFNNSYAVIKSLIRHTF